MGRSNLSQDNIYEKIRPKENLLASSRVEVCNCKSILKATIALYQNAILQDIVANQVSQCRKTSNSCIRKALDITTESNKEQSEWRDKISQKLKKLALEIQQFIPFRSSDEKDSFKSLTKNNHEAPNQSTEFAKSKRSVSKDSEKVRSVHFINELPQISVLDKPSSIINRWSPKIHAPGGSLSLKTKDDFDLLENGGILKIHQHGLYFIYSQIFFELKSLMTSQYEIRIKKANRVKSEPIAKCSVVASQAQGIQELSCFTSVVNELFPGDEIFVQLNELNRRITTRQGKTFFGIVRIASVD